MVRKTEGDPTHMQGHTSHPVRLHERKGVLQPSQSCARVGLISNTWCAAIALAATFFAFR